MQTSTLSGCEYYGSLSRRRLTNVGERSKVIMSTFVKVSTYQVCLLLGNPVLVPRVLEVIKSRLCYIIGTVYMDMPLKPNVMEDIARDVRSLLSSVLCSVLISSIQNSIPPPPPLPKFYSLDDRVMLEDESGRIRLVGDRVRQARLVTGIIIGALGAETANGDFEVVDICYPGLAPQPLLDHDEEDKMVVDVTPSTTEWIAVVSGLGIGSRSSSDAQIQMLVEYLTGEEGGMKEQASAAQISRLIIAGNSLADMPTTGRDEPGDAEQTGKAVSHILCMPLDFIYLVDQRRYGNEGATFSPDPILNLSAHLYDIASAMPVHILPGETDPSGVILPQQPLPRAMFGAVAKFSTFYVETNPTYLRFTCGLQDDGETLECSAVSRTLLINSGQPLNDMFKYLPSRRNTRLSILESTLRWRHMAPTAPDTLWCHPYFGGDPFIITETPDLYIVGNQERFATKLIGEESEDSQEGGARTRCRIVMVPDFARTGKLVLIDLRSLEVRTITFAVEGMTGGGEEVLRESHGSHSLDSTDCLCIS
jgi:DNA polymerase delta subunit 2